MFERHFTWMSNLGQQTSQDCGTLGRWLNTVNTDLTHLDTSWHILTHIDTSWYILIQRFVEFFCSAAGTGWRWFFCQEDMLLQRFRDSAQEVAVILALSFCFVKCEETAWDSKILQVFSTEVLEVEGFRGLFFGNSMEGHQSETIETRIFPWDSTGFQGRKYCHGLQFGPGHVPRHFCTVAEGTVPWQIWQNGIFWAAVRQPWRQPCTLWMKWSAHSLPGSKEHWAVHWTQRIHEPVSQAKDTNLSLKSLETCQTLLDILFQKSWDALWSQTLYATVR